MQNYGKNNAKYSTYKVNYRILNHPASEIRDRNFIAQQYIF